MKTLNSLVTAGALALGIATSAQAQNVEQKAQTPIEWRFFEAQDIDGAVKAYETNPDNTSVDVNGFRQYLNWLTENGSMLVTRNGDDENYTLFSVQSPDSTQLFLIDYVGHQRPYIMRECTFKKGNVARASVDFLEELTQETRHFEVTWNHGYHVEGVKSPSYAQNEVANAQHGTCHITQDIWKYGKRVSVGPDRRKNDVVIEHGLFEKKTAKYQKEKQK